MIDAITKINAYEHSVAGELSSEWGVPFDQVLAVLAAYRADVVTMSQDLREYRITEPSDLHEPEPPDPGKYGVRSTPDGLEIIRPKK